MTVPLVTDRVVLIGGGTRGLGAGIARAAAVFMAWFLLTPHFAPRVAMLPREARGPLSATVATASARYRLKTQKPIAAMRLPHSVDVSIFSLTSQATRGLFGSTVTAE